MREIIEVTYKNLVHMAVNNTSSISGRNPGETTIPALVGHLGGGPIRNASHAPKNGQRLSRFVFTLNNYTDEEYKWITQTFSELYKPSWLIVGKEVSESGTPHLQGACTLGTQRAFSTVKMWPGFRRAHLEQMHGSPQDSRIYCSKYDSKPFEVGTLPSPGKRTDIMNAVEAINSGMSLRQMASGDHGIAVVKFYKGLTILRSLRSAYRDPSKPPTVYWIYGPTGSNKTKCAWEFGTSIGPISDVWTNSGTLQWFDGYDGQRVAIFDDFRAKGVSFNFLLRLTDRYPMDVPFKGGFVNWNPEYIIFTGPESIRNAFATRAQHRPEDVGQLERRVTGQFGFPDDEARFRLLFGGVDVPEPNEPEVRQDVGLLSGSSGSDEPDGPDGGLDRSRRAIMEELAVESLSCEEIVWDEFGEELSQEALNKKYF